jgi:peroxiredoxin
MNKTSKKTNWINLIGLLLIIFLGVEDLFLIQQNRHLKESLSPPPIMLLKPGERVGAFKVQRSDGKIEDVTYADTTKKYMLFVLSTMCPHCHKNLQRWNEFANNNQDNRCRIIGISVNDLERTRSYNDTAGVNFELLTLADTSFARRYKVSAFPETILVDGNGTVEKAWAGELSGEAMNEIRTLLQSATKLTN